MNQLLQDSVIVGSIHNGTIRVFDVPKTTMVVEYQQHRGSVSALVYSADSKFLFSAGIDGHLVVYDVDNEDQA